MEWLPPRLVLGNSTCSAWFEFMNLERYGICMNICSLKYVVPSTDVRCLRLHKSIALSAPKVWQTTGDSQKNDALFHKTSIHWKTIGTQKSEDATAAHFNDRTSYETRWCKNQKDMEHEETTWMWVQLGVRHHGFLFLRTAIGGLELRTLSDSQKSLV